MDLPHVLTIAGSDSGGGAGIQADLKTFSALQVFGMSAITAVTVQNTRGVFGVHEVPAETVGAQIDAVFEDIRVDAVKIGMLASTPIILAVAASLRKWRPAHIVLDPVMISTSGHRLIKEEAMDALRSQLVPLATVVTPNMPEAERLADVPVRDREGMLSAAEAILALGPGAVLVKGGHSTDDADDLLLTADGPVWYRAARIASQNTHGTGCTLSSAIASFLARGESLATACGDAKAYVRRGIAANLSIGGGHGPLHHFVDWYPKH